ncbi:HalOD1 output domain-containing protein [Halorussus halobius]|uniref:HalOD1 output domain-containing protein n=1 Tax=Halorussus halobius TaxID=1710537 RepID=UPI001092808C|nr:HalOD1 output domain-containing protein [Halorussus halobius]
MTDEAVPGSTFTYDVSPSESLSEGVIAAVAAASDTDPLSLVRADEGDFEPLYSVIDPDALDAIFHGSDSGSRASDGRVTFTYHGHEVQVDGDGRITVARTALAASGD